MEGSSDSAFEELQRENNRNINCLSDKDRLLRKKSLDHFSKLVKDLNDDLLLKFWTTSLMKPIVNLIADQIEKHWVIAIQITQTVIKKLGFWEDFILVIPAILSRFNQVPFPE